MPTFISGEAAKGRTYNPKMLAFDGKVKALIAAAREAGNQAALAAGDDNSACGYAEVKFNPGQRALFNSFKRLNEAEGVTNRSGYAPYGANWYGEPGWYMNPHGHAANVQSVHIKEAYCRAFVKVIKESDMNIECRYSSRLD
jgi:hypothetical protein